jgi:DNA-binding MarR family transcriptional regulator
VAGVALLLGKVGAAMNRRVASALEAVGLRPKHLAALSVLYADEALSQQALGDKLGIDASAVVAIIDDLERDGLARRVRDPRDRRRHALHVTAAGSEMLARAQAEVAKVDTDAIATLSSEERAQLLALLMRIVSSDPDLLRVVQAGTLNPIS